MTTKNEVPLVESSTALESMRNSDFDVCSAYGEVVDNSIQANARKIKIRMDYKTVRSADGEAIVSIAFGDDGCGMTEDILQRCLQLGYSSRLNDRSGIGRFGVGATLAAINQAKRVEIYSKTPGGVWLYTYFDLDDIASKAMSGIPEPIKKEGVPAEFSELVDAQGGTLVIWKKYDRQPDDASRILDELKVWVGRTYRKFLNDGLGITINGEAVYAIDPLYVDLSKTRFPDDPSAKEFAPIIVPWPIGKEDRRPGMPTHSDITIRISLLPEELRKTAGSGGSKETSDRYINVNEGISIVRNRREVFYDHIPHWPGAPFAEIDRWWGCEIAFDAILDREFTVKNIKRGAVPIRELKKLLASHVNPTRQTCLESVREVWARAKAAALVNPAVGGVRTGHEDAENAAKKTPAPRSVLDASKNIEKEVTRVTEEWLGDQDERQKAAWQAKFKSQPFTIMDADWRGSEFIEASHLGGTDVLRYNVRHPFFTELKAVESALDPTAQDSSGARRLRALIDLLLMSHAKAEAMIDPKMQWEPEKLIETLRMQWGQYLSNYISTYKRETEDQ